jgi:hypothetical protein
MSGRRSSSSTPGMNSTATSTGSGSNVNKDNGGSLTKRGKKDRESEENSGNNTLSHWGENAAAHAAEGIVQCFVNIHIEAMTKQIKGNGKECTHTIITHKHTHTHNLTHTSANTQTVKQTNKNTQNKKRKLLLFQFTHTNFPLSPSFLSFFLFFLFYSSFFVCSFLLFLAGMAYDNRFIFQFPGYEISEQIIVRTNKLYSHYQQQQLR